MKIGYDLMGCILNSLNNSCTAKGVQVVSLEHIAYYCIEEMEKYGFSFNSLLKEQIREMKDSIPYINTKGLVDYKGDISDYSHLRKNVVFGLIVSSYKLYQCQCPPISNKVVSLFDNFKDGYTSLICFDVIKAISKDTTVGKLLDHYKIFDNIKSLDIMKVRKEILLESNVHIYGSNQELEDDIMYDDAMEEEEEDGEEEEIPKETILTEVQKMVKGGLVTRIDGNMFEVDPVIGREREINLIAEKMLKKKRSNVVMLGEPGTGKTEIVNGLAYRIAKGLIGGSFDTNYDVYSLSIMDLTAGTAYRGELEAKLQYIVNVLTELSKHQKVILFIDEIHLIVGTGASGNSSSDIANLLKPVLTTGNIKIIGSTTFEEYNKILKDKALDRRFESITIKEPNKEETLQILKGIAPQYEKHFDIKINDDILDDIVELSSNYIKDKFFPDKAIEALDSTLAYCKFNNKPADKDAVVHTISEISKIDISRVTTDKSSVADLKTKIEESLFGQEQAVNNMVKVIKTYKAGFNDENKPIANLLYCGKTGTGKTELCKIVAQQMGLKLIRFDMSEYAEEYTISKLIGSPAGYVGHDEGGLLTEAISKEPHSILLLDEIEKAHPKIFNLLLQIMDYGALTDSNGKKVDFTNVIIVMTSNAGISERKTTNIGFGATSNIECSNNVNELAKTFPMEFLGRLDNIIKFNGITKDIALKVIDKELSKVCAKASKKGYTVEIGDSAREKILENSDIEKLGARNICKEVQKSIVSLVVDYIIEEGRPKEITIDLNDNQFCIV